MSRLTHRYLPGLLVVATFSAAQGAESLRVEVETRGEPAEGELLRIEPDGRVVLRDATEVVLPPSETLRLRFGRARLSRPPGPALGEVELVEGSRFALVDYAVVGETLRLAFSGGGSVETTLRGVRSLRLGDSRDSPPAAEASDVLVVRRPDGDSTPLEGAAVGLSEEGVRFEFAAGGDGPVVAPWSRVAALSLFQPSAPKPSTAPAVELVGGGRVVAEGLFFDGVTVAWRSGRAPIAAVAAIDFSAGRVRQVSTLKLTKQSWRPYFGHSDDDPLGGHALNRALGGEPLSLRMIDPRAPKLWPRVAEVQTFTHGVALRSQGELRFELPKGAGRLRGLVGLDPATHAAGSAEVSLAAGDKTLWSGVVEGDTPPVTLDLPLEGAHELTLRIEYGDNLDSGDRVHFADLRVIP